jgi:MerR family redox-sensitive transcriptional activator SoxR
VVEFEPDQGRLEATHRAINHAVNEPGGCIGCGCLTMGECPLLNPGDSLGETNSGPVIFDQALEKRLET